MAVIATQSIDIDLTPGGVSPFLYVSQGDYGTRNLVFNLMMNGEPYTVPSSVTTVSLEGITKGGDLFNVTCSKSGSTITASLTADMTTTVGMDICQIVLKTASGRLGTANFFIIVEKSPTTIKVLYGNVYWSDLAKSWAVGGTDLRSDEEENNSKYWALLSKEWAASIQTITNQLNKNTNAISVLESQIAQHISPSSSSVDEVVDGRIGYNGTIYSNIGTAIRKQVTIYGYKSAAEEIFFTKNT